MHSIRSAFGVRRLAFGIDLLPRSIDIRGLSSGRVRVEFFRGSWFPAPIAECQTPNEERQTFTISYSEQSCLHLVKAGASFTTGRNDCDIWFKLMNILGKFRHADPHRFGEINFVDHHELSPKKHVRM